MLARMDMESTVGADPNSLSARRVLANGVVFDGTGAAPFRADVAVVDGQIAEIGADLDGGDVLDLTGRTLVPGFIDCHTHLAWDQVSSLDDSADQTPAYHALRSVQNLRATLDVGITTARDAAGSERGHRAAVADGLVPGPRMLLSLMQLSPTAGPYEELLRSGARAWTSMMSIPSPVADGPRKLRAKVREYVDAGADVIKIFATGPMSMPGDGARRSLFTDPELRAIVDEARRHDVRVMAHAHGAGGAIAAARAGVASIEHGVFLDDAAIDAMAEQGTVFVPTLQASVGAIEGATDDAARDRLIGLAAAHGDVVRRAHRRGVPIAMGTDCPMTAHGRNLEELERLVGCGLTPAEALTAATSTAAKLLGLGAEVGRIAVGMRADLVVLDGDPLDVTGLASRVRHVFLGGRRVAPTSRA